jgi:hypothetical protein
VHEQRVVAFGLARGRSSGGPEALLELPELLSLRCEAAGAGERGGHAGKLGLPALQQAAGDPEIVATSLTVRPPRTRATASFLNWGVNVRRIRLGFLVMRHLLEGEVSTFRGKVRQADRARASARAVPSMSALWNVSWCRRGPEALQLMRISLDGHTKSLAIEGALPATRIAEIKTER